MTETGSPEISHIAPVLRVRDLTASLAYYRDNLLFDVVFEWADQEGEPVRYAVLERGKSGVHLTRSDKPGGTTAYCFVDGVDGFYALVKAAGANITEDIANQPWNMREFETVDPDGNVLLFGEHLDRVDAAEADKPDAASGSPAEKEADTSQHRHLWNSFWYHGIFHPHDHTSQDSRESS
ncbi:catechol 2,3-dioxygenase-like lactoylglutathione lyase family enzyme [Labrenzia sp. EL_159]|nr:catechol 2,3-dioxygenase-like lactoylglutathione lyase family enzyme [Labrenzia sp. EL_162]MBG6196185.1 catechol 2,3-dioxygenase-like lactoylglutathione lyase family enzyme [Labrenzia sp. EL_159]